MLHEILAKYLNGVEEAILSCKTAYVERYIEEVLTLSFEWVPVLPAEPH